MNEELILTEQFLMTRTVLVFLCMITHLILRITLLLPLSQPAQVYSEPVGELRLKLRL